MVGPKTLTFAQQKGGTGKTISVCWMAWLLSQRYRVAVIDLDPQGGSTALLSTGDAHNHGAYEFMVADDVPRDAVVRSKFSKCKLVPATDALVMAEMDSRVQSLDFDEVRTRLSRTFQSFDYILIDCSSGLGILTSLAIALADKIIMPVFQAPLELRGLENTVGHISRMRRDANDVTIALPVMTEPDDLDGFEEIRAPVSISSVAIPYDSDAISLLSSSTGHSDVNSTSPMAAAYFAFIHELEGGEWTELAAAEPELDPQPEMVSTAPEPEEDADTQLETELEAAVEVSPPRPKVSDPGPQAETMTDIFDALHEKRSRASAAPEDTVRESKPPLPQSNLSRSAKAPDSTPPTAAPSSAASAPPTYQSLRDIHHDTLDEAPKVQTWFWLRLGLALIGIGIAIIGIFTDLIGPLAMWGAVIGVLILIVPDLIMRFLLRDR